MATSLINSFNAGELSPFLYSRTQLEKYASGCRVLENFIITPYGGVHRRPGTEMIGAPKFADKRCRLVGFNYSTSTRFVLEFGEGYLRFWSNGGQVMSGLAPLELATPWTEGMLRGLQFRQVNDILYIVHPDVAPRKLSRVSDTNWTLAEIGWTWPAFLDENIEDTTIEVSIPGVGEAGEPTAGKTGSMTATGNIFAEGHVGSYWQIAHRRDDAWVEKQLNSEGRSPGISVLGEWALTSWGDWTGTLRVQRSEDGETNWETIRSYNSKDDRNVSSTGVEEKATYLRIGFQRDSGNGRAYLEVSEARVYGIVKVTGYTSPTTVGIEIVKDLHAKTPTKLWAEGAWSAHRGFPRTVGLHEQRVIFGGTRHRPQMLWGSVVDDFENFRVSSLDDSAFAFQLAATEGNAIQWMQSQDELLIGTSGDEWTFGKADANEPITPTNIRARRQSAYGSKYFASTLINDVVLFVQRRGRKVRELVYAFEKDGWVAPDLTLLAEHVTKGEILESAYQQQPDAIYWAVCGSGQLIGMTYERDQQVVGWHRHTTQGQFESVATVYGNGTEDEVWFCVRRVIGGVEKRFIERFRLGWREALDEERKPDWFYVDCGRQVTLEPPSSLVSGLGYLNGAAVSILADGSVESEKVVSAGLVALGSVAAKVAIGLSFVSRLLPMRLEAEMQDGTSVSRIKRIARLVMSVYKSLGGQFSTNGVEWDDIYSRDTADEMDDSAAVFTGDKEVYAAGDFGASADVHIRQAQPLPLTILALVPRWEITGD